MNKEQAFNLLWDLVDDAPEHANDQTMVSILTDEGFALSDAQTYVALFWAAY